MIPYFPSAPGASQTSAEKVGYRCQMSFSRTTGNCGLMRYFYMSVKQTFLSCQPFYCAHSARSSTVREYEAHAHFINKPH